MNELELINRKEKLFEEDLSRIDKSLNSIVKESSFLIIGGAGSIGQAVTIEIFKRNPKSLHVVDISENNLVELVRNLRSSLGYISGEFKTFAIDCASTHFEALANEYSYDYVFNLSALKHVRSEKDPFTLMRMINVNIFNVVNNIKLFAKKGIKKYFCVSTDKATNPVNVMGASKLLMEQFMFSRQSDVKVSTARFANVAFSDGSLLFGFEQRLKKGQPLAIPTDIRRFFVTPEEAGQLCVISSLISKNREIFFPKTNDYFSDVSLFEIAKKYLEFKGFKPQIFDDETSARKNIKKYLEKGLWPCFCFTSDTTGEKPFEEFYTENETVNLDSLVKKGILFKPKYPLKVLGSGEISVKLKVVAKAFTKTAKDKIEAAGGSCEIIN